MNQYFGYLEHFLAQSKPSIDVVFNVYFFQDENSFIIFHLIMKVICAYYLKDGFLEKDTKMRKNYLESIYSQITTVDI